MGVGHAQYVNKATVIKPEYGQFPSPQPKRRYISVREYLEGEKWRRRSQDVLDTKIELVSRRMESKELSREILPKLERSID